jgi:[ribosomal protein S18]-alanine N-acetyltransferase
MIGFRPRARTLIEDARAEDAPAMAEIHEASFERAWSPEEMRGMIGDFPVVQPLVLRVRSRGQTIVAGFVILRIAGGEAEILTIAVAPKFRRCGYGRMLMEEAMRRVYRERSESLFLEVDEANRGAVDLYTKLGFKTVGKRPRYYEGAKETSGTALVMRLGLR